jgi:hypothetical protein
MPDGIRHPLPGLHRFQIILLVICRPLLLFLFPRRSTQHKNPYQRIVHIHHERIDLRQETAGTPGAWIPSVWNSGASPPCQRVMPASSILKP